MDLKQVILCRMDLKMSKGKLAAQVSHASVEAALRSHKDDLTLWRKLGMKKVVLKVKDLQELLTYKRKTEDAGLVAALVTDAGHTELAPGTVTCLGIGPAKEEIIDLITGSLSMV